MVGRVRCMSAANVSSDSAKKMCMPVRSQPCSTSTRSTTWASGRYDNMRSSPSMGTRLMAVANAHAKLPKVCITPFGMPVVPDV